MSITKREKEALRAMKPEEWPGSDRAAWESALAPADILELSSGGLGAHWKGSTVRTFSKAYGQFLFFLASQAPLKELAQPATRLNPIALGEYIEARQRSNAPGTVLGQVRALNCVAKAMYPHHDWKWMDSVIRNLSFKVKPARDKRGSIVPVQELLGYGLELMAKAETANGGTVFDKSLQYRDGLMIAMLASRPFREANFASITIGQHLVLRGETFWLQFGEHETKNGRPIELPLPQFLNTYINRYCDHFRPALFPRNRGWTSGSQETGLGCAALWLSSRGRPMPPNTVYERITAITRVKFGRAINPHLFRDCAATSIAIDDPEHVRIAAKLLGHSQTRTTERYYVQAQSFEASRRYQRAIRAERDAEPRASRVDIQFQVAGVCPDPSQT